MSDMGKMRNVYTVPVGKPEGKRPLQRPKHRQGIILQQILKKWDVRVWTGFSWLRMESSGRLLCTQ
jgi:hypothetical protein